MQQDGIDCEHASFFLPHAGLEMLSRIPFKPGTPAFSRVRFPQGHERRLAVIL